MPALRFLSTAAALVMGTAIAVAIVTGDIAAEGSEILALAWGRVSLIDIYVGVVIVAAWIVWRDGAGPGAAWLVALVVLGHLATAVYVAWRSWTCDGVADVLIGPRRTDAAPRDSP